MNNTVVQASHEDQLRSNRVFAPGFQEHRATKKGVCDAGGFIKVYSSPCRGQCGDAMWINKAIRIGTYQDRKVKVKPDAVFILYAEPRALVVRVVTSVATFCIASIHFPHSGRMQHAQARKGNHKP